VDVREVRRDGALVVSPVDAMLADVALCAWERAMVADPVAAEAATITVAGGSVFSWGALTREQVRDLHLRLITVTRSAT
jgi:hypothetical protein